MCRGVAAAFADGSAFVFRPEYDNPTGQEDFLRQTVTLAEEFLTLLIIILGQFHHHHWCGGWGYGQTDQGVPYTFHHHAGSLPPIISSVERRGYGQTDQEVPYTVQHHIGSLPPYTDSAGGEVGVMFILTEEFLRLCGEGGLQDSH